MSPISNKWHFCRERRKRFRLCVVWAISDAHTWMANNRIHAVLVSRTFLNLRDFFSFAECTTMFYTIEVAVTASIVAGWRNEQAPIAVQSSIWIVPGLLLAFQMTDFIEFFFVLFLFVVFSSFRSSRFHCHFSLSCNRHHFQWVISSLVSKMWEKAFTIRMKKFYISKRLNDRLPQHPTDRRNPISLCSINRQF